jgi:hypothetical protein
VRSDTGDLVAIPLTNEEYTLRAGRRAELTSVRNIKGDEEHFGLALTLEKLADTRHKAI